MWDGPIGGRSLVSAGERRLISMTPTIEILISSPVSGSEALALRDFAASLSAPALILANFEISCAGAAHEIDFVVVTQTRAELIELKNFTAPVNGGVNGPWRIEKSPGHFVPYVGPNPWEQARDAKLALSDAMHDYASTRLAIPRPAKRRYFEEFDASVTVYPSLMPGSEVRAGNFKAWVRSFPDSLECLNSRPLPLQSGWKVDDWRQFAVDYLGLTPASLVEAVEPAVFRANQLITEYAENLRYSDIPPLLPAQEQELVGQHVIERLRTNTDVLLLGRSGLGKSFHLEHYRRVCFEFNEIPILLNARYYQRDLQKAIYKTVAPFTILAPAELLDAAKKLGRRPILIVDGWNECPVSLQFDLGNDLRAFQLRYDARLVTASQIIPQHDLFAEMDKIEIDPLRVAHKQAIVAFHCGRDNEQIPDHFYKQFSTAFELTIAGRCQRDGAVAETRAELYESYVRSSIPSISARSVLRKLAWYMGENYKPVILLSEFERAVEHFVEEMGLSLSIADQLLQSRLLEVGRETVAFEHELLKEYFRAEEFLRESPPEQIPILMEKPKYAGLAEFVIPSARDVAFVRELLEKAEIRLLDDAFRGRVGNTAKDVICEECRAFLSRCRNHLENIQVEAFLGQLDDGRRFVSAADVVGDSYASDRDRLICTLIAGNLDDYPLQQAFLELLDLGEWALTQASDRAGRALGIRHKAIFQRLVHDNVIGSHSGAVHPFLFLCHLVTCL